MADHRWQMWALRVLVCLPCCGLLAQAPRRKAWVVPRAPDGHPDLQGNWSNSTLTPLERPQGLPRALSPQQAADVEKVRADSSVLLSQDSDPNRPAPPKGGDGSVGPGGGTGGHNYFWFESGDHIAIVNGERRSSFIVEPADGRVPPLTDEGRRRIDEWAVRRAKFGEFDNPENRPLAERCLLSFGMNAGPPMLPNYAYNNNYTIVQTKDHVLIMTEMVHDVRIIPLGRSAPPPTRVRPWMGVSSGRWDGDTLVVQTSNVNPAAAGRYRIGPDVRRVFGWSDSLTVTERFHRVDERTILYRFTVRDPLMYTRPWSGELPLLKMDERIYEYACHEGNYAMQNILSGERSLERAAAAAPVSGTAKP